MGASVNPFLQNSLFYGSFPKLNREICVISRLDKKRPIVYNIFRGTKTEFPYIVPFALFRPYIQCISRM